MSYTVQHSSCARVLSAWYMTRPLLEMRDLAATGANIEGLFIESWSGSTGYSIEMLTEGAQSWRVEDSSTLTPSVIKFEYPAISDYDEIEITPFPPRFVVNKQ